MPDDASQNLSNHTKLDPPFHFFLLPLAAANVIVGIVAVYNHQTFAAIWQLVMALVLAVAIFKIRVYALKVQDRVIRLEERIRLALLLPDAMQSRIGELSVSQLVAIRFASDGEVPGLVQKVISGSMKNADIKKAIQTWRPDTHRV